MNISFNGSPMAATIAMPAELEMLSPPPQLLPGESHDHYKALQAAIFLDLAPRSAIEWLLAIDVAEVSWEIQRYRLLRDRLLEVYRQKGIEMSLRWIDVTGVAPAYRDEAELRTARNAAIWRLDPAAADEIEQRLASYGFDRHAVSMEVYVQAREAFALFKTLINTAQIRRMLLLKVIAVSRQPTRARTTDREDETLR